MSMAEVNKRAFALVQRSVGELYHSGEIKPIVFGQGQFLGGFRGRVHLSRVVLCLSHVLEASSPVHPAPG